MIMKYRIAILPSAKVSKKAGKLAKQFSRKFPSYFAVDNQKLLPHVTLLVVDMSANKRSAMLADLGRLLGKQQSLSLSVAKFDSFLGGWFALKIDNSVRLTNLRLRLARKLKKYGTIKQKSFRPHITLTKFKQAEDAKIAQKMMTSPSIKFDMDTIGVCLSNKYGQVYKIIKKFKLKS